MDLKEVEKLVTKIQRQLFRNSNSYSIGMLATHFRGSGLQFKEHQIYCHGDDVRFIDWKLYARTNTPYIKTFEEERNIEIIIFLDLSLSMLMGYKGTTKLQAAINIACLISLLARETSDCVRFVLLGDEERVLPTSSGKKAIIHLVSELRKINIMNGDGTINIAYRPQTAISPEKTFKAINMFIKKKKEVVILSDFSDLLAADDLKQISWNRRAHCFRIVSPLDKAEKVRFSIYSFNASTISQEGARVVSLNTGKQGQKGVKEPYAHIKEIDIEGRYMEEFVKELV